MSNRTAHMDKSGLVTCSGDSGFLFGRLLPPPPGTLPITYCWQVSILDDGNGCAAGVAGWDDDGADDAACVQLGCTGALLVGQEWQDDGAPSPWQCALVELQALEPGRAQVRFFIGGRADPAYEHELLGSAVYAPVVSAWNGCRLRCDAPRQQPKRSSPRSGAARQQQHKPPAVGGAATPAPEDRDCLAAAAWEVVPAAVKAGGRVTLAGLRGLSAPSEDALFGDVHDYLQPELGLRNITSQFTLSGGLEVNVLKTRSCSYVVRLLVRTHAKDTNPASHCAAYDGAEIRDASSSSSLDAPIAVCELDRTDKDRARAAFARLAVGCHVAVAGVWELA